MWPGRLRRPTARSQFDPQARCETMGVGSGVVERGRRCAGVARRWRRWIRSGAGADLHARQGPGAVPAARGSAGTGARTRSWTKRVSSRVLGKAPASIPDYPALRVMRRTATGLQWREVGRRCWRGSRAHRSIRRSDTWHVNAANSGSLAPAGREQTRRCSDDRDRGRPAVFDSVEELRWAGPTGFAVRARSMRRLRADRRKR